MIDGYSITITLHNFLIFHSPIDKKEVLLYFEIIEHLQDARIVNCYQTAILQANQDLDYEIYLFSQFHSYILFLRSLISFAQLFITITTYIIALTWL